MQRTLIICGLYPLPENIGGNIRTMHFVRFFRKLGPVDVAFNRVLPDAQLEEGLFPGKLFIETDGHILNEKSRLQRIFRMKAIPWPVIKHKYESIQKLMSEIELKDYDFILVRYITNTQCLVNISEKFRHRTIIDFDDVFSDLLYKMLLDYENREPVEKAFLLLNQCYLKRYERQCLNYAASLFCSTDDIRKFSNKRGYSNMYRVPNVYDDRAFKFFDFGCGFGNGNILLFVGILNYEPNYNGLKWFIESIFPDFKKVYHDARLLIVGRYPGEEITLVSRDVDGVELIGDVPDVRKYYKLCRAVVVPILAGGGTRIKILEAALAGRPILTTHTGAEGLDLADEGEIIKFNFKDDFLERYQELSEKKSYDEIVSNAKKNVSRNYTISRFDDAMQNVINDLNLNAREAHVQ